MTALQKVSPSQTRPAGTPPSTFLFLPIHLSNSPGPVGPTLQLDWRAVEAQDLRWGGGRVAAVKGRGGGGAPPPGRGGARGAVIGGPPPPNDTPGTKKRRKKPAPADAAKDAAKPQPASLAIWGV